MEDRVVFIDVIEEPDRGSKEAAQSVGIILQCCDNIGDVTTNLDYNDTFVTISPTRRLFH